MTNAQLDSLRVGSIVRRPNAGKRRTCPYRVVREMTMKVSKGKLRPYYFTFTIQGHSWTKNAYTTYCRPDLATFGYVGTGAALKLRSKFDRRFAKSLRAPRFSDGSVKPSEVIGLVY